VQLINEPNTEIIKNISGVNDNLIIDLSKEEELNKKDTEIKDLTTRFKSIKRKFLLFIIF